MTTVHDVVVEAISPDHKMMIKFPRTVFEEAVAKLEKKGTKRPKKEGEKKKVFAVKFSRHDHATIEHSYPSPSPSPSQSPPADSPPHTPIDDSHTPPPIPTETSSPESNIPSPVFDPATILVSHDHRPSRESKTKFYELLSSVVKGDSCPNYFDGEDESEEATPNKSCLLTKSQKKDIARLLLYRRHFPAEISMVEGKGTGVKTLRAISCGQYICEYAGELITKTEALKREKVYAATSKSYSMSCYMYYFEHRGQEMCVDATSEEGAYGIGRLINHSLGGNLDTVKIVVNGIPRLALVANRDICAGEELSYDYGDRTSLAAFPWLNK